MFTKLAATNATDMHILAGFHCFSQAAAPHWLKIPSDSLLILAWTAIPCLLTKSNRCDENDALYLPSGLLQYAHCLASSLTCQCRAIAINQEKYLTLTLSNIRRLFLRHRQRSDPQQEGYYCIGCIVGLILSWFAVAAIWELAKHPHPFEHVKGEKGLFWKLACVGLYDIML